MTDLIAGLALLFLLAALYAVRRHARNARARKVPRRARAQYTRTLSARTEMRAFSHPTTTAGMLKKRARRIPAAAAKRA